MPKQKLAVCIGISDYPGTDSDLKGCVNDANDWADTLANYGFSVARLINAAATKEAILDAMELTIARANKDDSIVFVYSGHGSWQPDGDDDEPDQRDEGWCPYDIQSNGLLTDDEMYDVFSNLGQYVKLVIISDSCHSGSVSKDPVSDPAACDDSTPRIKYLPPNTFLKKSIQSPDNRVRRGDSQIFSKPDITLLIAGCQDFQESFDATFGGRPNGVLTYYALQALKKLPSGATYTNWHKEILRIFPKNSYPQTPNLVGSLSQREWIVFE